TSCTRFCARSASEPAMTANGWLQIALFFVTVVALAKPLGVYMHRVFEGPVPLPSVAGPIERTLLGLCGVDAKREQSWVEYTVALLVFSALGVLVTYGVQRLQHVLPLNPQGFGSVEPTLAFNT